MIEYSSGETTNRPFSDRDLKHRLMAKIGRPLTASVAPPGTRDEEPVAETGYESLVSSLYMVAFSDAAIVSVPQEKPNGASE